MKKNDSEDFCLLFIEPGDERINLFPIIASQNKPVVLMLAEQTSVFQRPADFVTLKHVKRQHRLTVVFVLAREDQRAQLAARSGFAVYPSMESLVKAVGAGQMVRQRTMSRTTLPLFSSSQQEHEGSQRTNGPITPFPPSIVDEPAPEPGSRMTMRLSEAELDQQQYSHVAHQSTSFSSAFSQEAAQPPLTHSSNDAFAHEFSDDNQQSFVQSQSERPQEHPQIHQPISSYPGFFPEEQPAEYPRIPDPVTPYQSSPYLFQNGPQAGSNPDLMGREQFASGSNFYQFQNEPQAKNMPQQPDPARREQFAGGSNPYQFQNEPQARNMPQQPDPARREQFAGGSNPYQFQNEPQARNTQQQSGSTRQEQFAGGSNPYQFQNEPQARNIPQRPDLTRQEPFTSGSAYLFQSGPQVRNNPVQQPDLTDQEQFPIDENPFLAYLPEFAEEDQIEEEQIESSSDAEEDDGFLIAGPPAFAFAAPTPPAPAFQPEPEQYMDDPVPDPVPQLRQDVRPAAPPPAPARAPQINNPESFPPTLVPVTPRRFPWLLGLISLLLIAIVLGSSLLLPHLLQLQNLAAAPESVGSIVFASSGHVNEDSNQGISDQIEMNLTNLAAPASQTAYYAWLLSDKTQPDPTALLLGTLQVKQGNAQLFYAGDAQHTNLLEKYSQFLITQESASVPPSTPTPDQSAWRYYGAFSTTPTSGPDNPKHFSYLDHLRHLLASDPTLDELQLPGGLNSWFFNNTEKIFEWSSSMRGTWEQTKDAGFTRRMAARILEYLDGTTYVYLDLPKGTPLLVNERLARVGLLTVAGPDQQPASYFQHIDSHLSGLLAAGDNTPALTKQIASLTSSMNSIQQWLTQVRTDAKKLEAESDTQLTQSSTLDTINDMIVNSNNAYAGSIDPATGNTQPGVLWLHSHMQGLATMNITVFSAKTASQFPQFKAAQA